MKENVWNDKNLIEVLENNGVVIMPTDTIYGIVGKARSENTVKRIYEIRGRNPQKPCIILIGDIKELEKFLIILSEKQKQMLEIYWPGPVSIVFNCLDDKFTYLHRGTKTLAFRLPAQAGLRKLLLKTGPLIAPSANKETFPPHETAEGAKKYFGDSIDLYIDGGEIKGKASKVIRLHNNGSVTVLRE